MCIEYLAVTSTCENVLTKQVNAAIRKGFVPFGGLTSSSNNGVTVYTQAMVVKGEEND